MKNNCVREVSNDELNSVCGGSNITDKVVLVSGMGFASALISAPLALYSTCKFVDTAISMQSSKTPEERAQLWKKCKKFKTMSRISLYALAFAAVSGLVFNITAPIKCD